MVLLLKIRREISDHLKEQQGQCNMVHVGNETGAGKRCEACSQRSKNFCCVSDRRVKKAIKELECRNGETAQTEMNVSQLQPREQCAQA